jgi:hypothetical protein
MVYLLVFVHQEILYNLTAGNRTIPRNPIRTSSHIPSSLSLQYRKRPLSVRPLYLVLVNLLESSLFLKNKFQEK